MRWQNKPVLVWSTVFAVFPTRMHDGVWVWLEQYERMPCNYGNKAYRRALGSDYEPFYTIDTMTPLELRNPILARWARENK